MQLSQSQYRRITLHAGDIYFGQGHNTRIHTLLGSCVSITLWHPELKIGGMCHFALPQNPDIPKAKFNPRFGDDCIKIFKRKAQRFDTSLHEYHAKVFGGGNMYVKHANHNISDIQRKPVGEKNVMAAFEGLYKEDVQILVAHIGEFGYRNIVFDINSGDVFVKFTPINCKGNQNSLTGNS